MTNRIQFTGLICLTLMMAGCADNGGPCDDVKGKCAGPSYDEGEAAEISLDRRAIDFGRFAPGVTESEVVLVENSRAPTLEIESIELVEETLDDPGGAELRLEVMGSRVLGAGDSLEIRVIYEAADEASDAGFVRIESNAATERTFISIDSTTTHCSRTQPEEIDFGEVRLGESVSRAVEVENCNPDVPLRVTQLFVDRYPDVFTIETTGFDRKDGELYVPPDSVAIVEVRFQPEIATDYFSRLAVFTEDRENDKTVVLSGAGVF